ncbi:capsid [Molossus molossus circovirus 3]|uniref:capsid n=1 Tax=Molossus molossus circovirus 3 TaxID=1959844 RepID=UPI000CA381F6|nr:capsid [Molossus molossus circovirus 3]AQR57901.1 capsid [Molossus molossus circovirus 3]
MRRKFRRFRRKFKKFSRRFKRHFGGKRRKTTRQVQFKFKVQTVPYLNGSIAPSSSINWNNTSNTASHYTFAFTLGDIPHYSDLSSVFDAAKLAAVKLKFVPRYTMGQLPTSASTTYANTSTPCVVVKDYDDANPLTSYANALLYQNARVVSILKPFSVYLKPKLSGGVENTSLVIVAQSQARPWLDSGATAVPYYGVKLEVPGINTTQMLGQAIWDIYGTYYVKLKQIRLL